MAESAVTVELLNRRAWRDMLVAANARALDFRVPLTLIGRSLFNSSQQEIFDLSGPGKYEDLRDSTKKMKQKQWNFIYPILKASGQLMDSLTQQGNAENVFRLPNATTLEWGTKVPYGLYHQSENPRKKTKDGRIRLPRRPFLLVTDQRLYRWRLILSSHLTQSFAKPIKESGSAS